MCMKKIKENRGPIVAWFALVLTILSILSSWGEKAISKDNNQDINIAVLNEQLKTMNDRLKVIDQKLDFHINKEVVK